MELLLHFFNSSATVANGIIAGQQFNNSDISAIFTTTTFSLISGVGGLLSLILLIALLAIWCKPIIKFIIAITATIVVVFGLSISLPDRAYAYFDTIDKTEAYSILPNQSAFWIPDTAANKDTQVQFESESYYQERKIPFKRFVIPHVPLKGSAGNSMFSGWDYYVPTGRLYIVDRTPYSREWVDSTDRGTSLKKKDFLAKAQRASILPLVLALVLM